MGNKLVFDIEANGLKPDTIWMIVAENIETGNVYKFSDHDNLHGSIADGANMLQNAEVLIGHNIIGYDLPVVDKLCGTNLMNKEIVDTWIMSMVLRYERPFTRGHGLGDWGTELGTFKGDYDGGWDNYSKEMLRYCVQDVKVNVQIYNKLMVELEAIAKVRPLIHEGLKVEQDTAIFNARVKKLGWNFDTIKAEDNHKAMTKRLEEIERIVEPQLGKRAVVKDKEPKTVKFSANGNYHSITARILSEILQVEVKQEDTHLIPAGTTYQRVSYQQIELGQVKYVKERLMQKDIGWKPTEYTKKKVNGSFRNVSPKLTEDSLEPIGELGQQLKEYLTIRNRRSVIEGWQTRQVDGRIHGNMWTVGTPTFRCRHEGIVNLPAVSAPWGQQVRELLTADEGTVIVGADSSGNQLRALCHYVNNADFTNEVINGDQHQRNADALGCSRPVAKSYLYAYLFGAGDAKLGHVLTGSSNRSVGAKSRVDFAKGIKGLAELKARITTGWKNKGSSSFFGLDGRLVFCSSEHQLLNYLLQSAEGITCKAAVSYAMRKIDEEGLRAEPKLFYHDEIAYQSHPDDAARVGEILQEAFKIAPETFGVKVMDGGDPMFGDNYSAVH